MAAILANYDDTDHNEMNGLLVAAGPVLSHLSIIGHGSSLFNSKNPFLCNVSSEGCHSATEDPKVNAVQ